MTSKLGSTVWSQEGLAFVVFDLNLMRVEGSGAFPGADFYLPQGERLLVLRDGRVDSLDLSSGSLTILASGLSDGVEVLLPGR